MATALSASSVGLLLDAYLRDSDSQLRLSEAIRVRREELPADDRRLDLLQEAQEKLARGAILSMRDEKLLTQELGTRKLRNHVPRAVVPSAAVSR